MTLGPLAIAEWRRRSAAANRAVATKKKKYKKWPAHRGPRGLKPLARMKAWPVATSVGDILCPAGCRGRLMTTSETVRMVGGGAAQLFRIHSETKRCTECKARYQVVTITPEDQTP